MSKKAFTEFMLRHIMFIELLLGMCSILLAIGLTYSATLGVRYDTIFAVLPKMAWIGIFACYGVIKIVDVLHDLPFLLKLLASIVGIFSWTMLAISFIFDRTIDDPVELLLTLPIMSEVWVLTILLYKGKDNAT